MALHSGLGRGPGHLRRMTQGSSSGLTLDNATILDRSGTLAKVGTLLGVNGSPTLTDNAGGRFLLIQVGATWELRCGLVSTDHGINASHTVTNPGSTRRSTGPERMRGTAVKRSASGLQAITSLSSIQLTLHIYSE